MLYRTVYFDLLNVFACISVVALHCNSYTHSFAHDAAWMQAVFFETFFYPAVPIFFMLSGATLLNYRSRYSTKCFFEKRIKKTVVPYIFFMTFFLVLSYVRNLLSGNPSMDIHTVLTSFFTGSVRYAHYWFFIPLFMFYLFAPFLERISSHSQTKELVALCIVAFFFQTIVPLVNYFGDFSITQSTAIYGFSIYALWGYALHNSNYEKNKLMLFILCFLTVAVYVLRYCGIVNSMEKSNLLFNYFGIYSVIPATFFFLLFKKYDSFFVRFPSFCGKIALLSSCSFGIYLLHGLVIACLPFDEVSLFRRTIGILVVYLCSAAVVFVLKKIRIFKWIVP